MADRTTRPTTIAFYLPQFYPIPENDGWYGQGFTEWRNVVQARPLFEGHYQPHLPSDLGFYDLRVLEVREQQARMARQYGIDAFCYYHYWFQGQRPLKIVIDDMLSQGTPDIPFCLAWANENWSRHWDASRHEVLLKQTYSPEDDEAHGQFLLQAMLHPRYLRVDGKPILFVYRIQAIPDAAATMARWRQMWSEAGLGEVEIVKFDTHGDFENPAIYGANSAAQFLPHGVRETLPRLEVPDSDKGNLIFSYEEVAKHYLAMPQPEWRRHECVLPSWDNAPRRGDGASLLIHGSTPERYQNWLAAVHERTPADGLVLINAWNEWAEGAHLEPDLKHGHAYLEATARAVGAPPVEPIPWGYEPSGTAADQEKRLADLYLDACEAQARLQRRLSRLEATVERQIEFATQEAREQAAVAEAQAVELAREVDRLTNIERLGS